MEIRIDYDRIDGAVCVECFCIVDVEDPLNNARRSFFCKKKKPFRKKDFHRWSIAGSNR